jgi:hypothetical protein
VVTQSFHYPVVESAEAFNEPSIARHPGIGDHDPVKRPLLGATARQANFQWHGLLPFNYWTFD